MVLLCGGESGVVETGSTGLPSVALCLQDAQNLENLFVRQLLKVQEFWKLDVKEFVTWNQVQCMWVRGSYLGTSGRAASAINHWTSSQPSYDLKMTTVTSPVKEIIAQNHYRLKIFTSFSVFEIKNNKRHTNTWNQDKFLLKTLKLCCLSS